MCDVEKINTFSKELLNMDLSDFRELILKADSDELKDYYVSVYNYVLQKRQKEILKEHVY